MHLVYTTQVNSTFHARWLASSEVTRQVLFTFEQPKKNYMAFDGILSQIKSLFGLLVIIQLVWYMLKTIIHLSVGESGGYFTSPLHGLVDQYPPLFTFTSVNNNIVKY